jgi:hypothetical protein
MKNQITLGKELSNKMLNGRNSRTENLNFDYYEDKIIMNNDTKDAILDVEELQQFITPKSFVINKTGQMVLWVDWMNYEQFDKLAKFLNIKY